MGCGPSLNTTILVLVSYTRSLSAVYDSPSIVNFSGSGSRETRTGRRPRWGGTEPCSSHSGDFFGPRVGWHQLGVYSLCQSLPVQSWRFQRERWTLPLGYPRQISTSTLITVHSWQMTGMLRLFAPERQKAQRDVTTDVFAEFSLYPSKLDKYKPARHGGSNTVSTDCT